MWKKFVEITLDPLYNSDENNLICRGDLFKDHIFHRI